MKKISILLFAIMMAGSLNAQIDSFDDSENFVTKPKSTLSAFNKLTYLSPYKGRLSVYDESKWDTVLNQWGTIYNVIGEQVFYMGDKYKNDIIVITNNKKEIDVSLIKPATYYTVKDILISQEEIDSLRRELANSPQCQVSHLLFQLCHTEFQPKDWFWKDIKNRKGEVEYWMYILEDDNNIEYYVPNVNPDAINLHFPEMRDNFIMVKGFLSLKQKFENQRIFVIYDRDEGDKIKLCKKIAYKDKSIMAAITDTLSTSVSYERISDFVKEPFDRYYQKDSLFYMAIQCPGDCSKSYCSLHEIDSLKAKNAYENHLAEIEKAKKDEKRKQELIKKYGKKYGTSIFNKEACVGMTKAMCKEAIGSPDQVTKSQTASGNVEVWSYTLAYQAWKGLAPIIVVTFTNDRVTAVDKYTSWPF